MTVPSKKIDVVIKAKNKTKSKKVDWAKYSGVIKLKEDPLTLQKKWRDEWK